MALKVAEKLEMQSISGLTEKSKTGTFRPQTNQLTSQSVKEINGPHPHPGLHRTITFDDTLTVPTTP